MPPTVPWSKKHKAVTRHGGLPYNLSNSFAQPTSHRELVTLAEARGDTAIIEAYNDHDLGYTPNGGSLDLREEIAKLYGPAITADHVLVFPGAQHALEVAAAALARDAHAIVFTPGYQSVLEAPIHAGAQVTRIPLSAETNWDIDIADVEAAIRDDTKYMVVNQPWNPAGRLMGRELQKRLADVADRHGIYLLSDEVYRLLEHDPADRLPAMADLYHRGLSAVTMSKPWGAGGVSIGWLAFQDQSIRQKLVDVQYFGCACPSRASEIQAIMVLRASDVLLERNLKILRRNLGLLDVFMATYADLFSWVRPNAGAICFLRFKGPMTTTELGDVLAGAGISIKPAYCFTSETITEANDYFRVGFGEENMPKALAALTEFVEANKSEWLCKAST